MNVLQVLRHVYRGGSVVQGSFEKADIILWLSISTFQRTLYGGKGADRGFPLMSPPVKRCHCPARPPRRIHTHISSAGLVTRLNRIESWKAISKIVLLQQKTFVKTSSWLFSFKQFAKCFLSKEGEALRKWDILKLIKELYPGPAHFPGLRQWDMTSLSWSKNLTLVFLASWYEIAFP